MQAGHDGAERTVERARDLAVAELVDVGELEDAALGAAEAKEGGAQRRVVDDRRRLGRRGDQLAGDHARAHALVATAAALLGDGEVVQDAAQPGAAVRARAITMARGERAREGLLHQVVGVGAEAARQMAQKRCVRQELGSDVVEFHAPDWSNRRAVRDFARLWRRR
jgi:hypothetical protein